MEDPVLSMTIGSFQRWLGQHASSAIIGYCQEAAFCPIATYLRSFGVESQIDQFMIVYVCDGDHRRILMPNWVGRFVNILDRQKTSSEQKPVTAGMAMSVLLHVASGTLQSLNLAPERIDA